MKSKILLGTGNAGKIKEMRFYLRHFNIFQTFETLTPSDFKHLSKPIEDGTTFEANANGAPPVEVAISLAFKEMDLITREKANQGF